MIEKTLLIVKPDAVKRGLVEEVSRRIEAGGLKVSRAKEMTIPLGLAREHYAEHEGKPFFDGLIKYMTSGPVVLAVAEGEEAVSRAREMMGPTDPSKAGAGTIRGDLKQENYINEDGIIQNLVHGSDSSASAEREISIFYQGEKE